MDANVWRPAPLTPEQMEERRLAAATLLHQGQLSQAQIARCCHVNCHQAHCGRFGRRTGSSSNVSHSSPFRHGIDAVQMRGRGGAAGARWNEEIADGREDTDEPLQVPW
jgi:hypothetical protein